MEDKGRHTDNRKYYKYGMRSNAGKYLVQCPYCNRSYFVSAQDGGNFQCADCGGAAGLQHVIKEIVVQEKLDEMHDVLRDNYNQDEILDVRDAGNNSKEAGHIRASLEQFVYAVSIGDEAYILSRLHRSGLNSTLSNEERFLRFKRSAFGRYLGNAEIGLQDAVYLSGYPWPEGYNMLQQEMSGYVDYDGDGIPDEKIKGYQHFEVTLTDGEVFDVYCFEGEEDDWTLRIL